ncbi:MAG TPA: chitobiase/beta-hexosaminidase C-terminal domain-containing protein [Oculatellaceae cyanobacterium]
MASPRILLRSCAVLLTIPILLTLSAKKALALTAPSMSATSGSFITPQTVSITAPSGSLFYSLDGSVPTSASTPYTVPIVVTEPTQINVVAYQSGVYSAVTTAYLDVDPALMPILQPGLMLRLRADFGVQTDSNSPGSIQSWVDLSGAGNTATGSAGTQPTLATPVPGITAANFNGSSQSLSLPTGFTQVSHIFLVVQPVGVSAGARFFDLGNGNANNNIYMSEPSSNAFDFHLYSFSTGSSVSDTSGVTLGQYQLIEADYNGGTSVALVSNGTAGAQSSSMQVEQIVARSNNFIGQASGGGNYYNGRIAEILMYQTPLSTSQIAQIQAYLISKYQLLSSVPGTPIISLPSATLTAPATIAIATQAGTTTFFTLDGSTPSTSSKAYTGCPINISYSQTLKAISYKNGVASGVASATYTLDSNRWPAPPTSDLIPPVINLQLPAVSK